MENSKRKTVILKVTEGYRAYGEMLHYYAVKNLMAWVEANPGKPFGAMKEELSGKRVKEWANLGGQIMQKKDLDLLRADIVLGRYPTWRDIHKRYDKIWQRYPLDKQRHALAVLGVVYCTRSLTEEQWADALGRAGEIQQYVSAQVYSSRKKDYENPFKFITFRDRDEMKAALGTVDENSFIVQVRAETEEMLEKIGRLKAPLSASRHSP
jgi:hypothetical protein